MNITKSVVSERDRALIGGDYRSYHAQATRRIQKLRRKLGASTPKGRKYTSKSAVTAQDVAKNSEWVQLLLTSAERAWAEAMAMKSIQSPENTQKAMQGSTKRQIISRLRRAITYASNLVQILEDQATTKATSSDVLEAKAYLYLLKGGSDFERNKWSPCIKNYSFSRQVYTALTTQKDADTFKDLLEGTIDPSIRYAAYQIKLPRTKAVSDISIENFPTSEDGAKKEILNLDDKVFQTSSEKAAAQAEGMVDLPTTIVWRDRKVKLEDASISQALAAAKSKEEDLSETYTAFEKGTVSSKDLATAYDDIINARQDAADATKTVLDELIAEGADQSDTRIQGLQVTRTAVNYAVIEWRVGRNRVLCGDHDGLTFETAQTKPRAKPRKDGKVRTVKEEPSGRKVARLRERVALYDSILQNIEAVKQLPGVIADTKFVEELDQKRNYFRALKCLAIGRSHAVNGHIRNALALFARAEQLVRGMKGTSNDKSGIPKLDITEAQAQQTQQDLTSLVLQYRALADLTNAFATSRQASQGKTYVRPLIERLHLNQYDDQVDLKNIVNYPPKLQPIPMKPIFYDLAWDYIKYPGQEVASSHDAATAIVPSTGSTTASADRKQEEAPKKKGWFGFGR